MIKLTKAIVERTAPPTSGDLFLWDASQPGFGIRIKPSGKRSYVVQYRNRFGRSRRFTLGQHGQITLDQARKLAAGVLRSVAGGADPAAEKKLTRAAPTIDDLADHYRELHAPTKRKSSRACDEVSLKLHLLPDLGRRRVAEVTSADVQRLHLKLRAKPYAANRALALLSKMFSLAIAAGWRPDNPCRGVARFQEEKRQRWLSDIELGRLLDMLNQYPNRPAANAVKLLLLTGARRGEVLLAKWADLDIERGSWTKPAHTTKQRRTETVPLSGAALRLLASMRAEDRASEYLLGGDGLAVDHLAKAWRAITKATQLEGVRLHDLRHTFASHLVSSGLSLHIVGALLGHAHPQTTARYAHLSNDALRHAADRFGSKLASLDKPDESMRKIFSVEPRPRGAA